MKVHPSSIAALLGLGLVLAGATVAVAGDHTDSPATRANQAADLADAYVFPVKSQAGGTRVVMVLTVHPYSSPPTPPDLLVPSKRSGTQLSDAVEYVFRLRPAEILGRGAETRIATDGAQELDVICTVDDSLYQHVTCVTRAGSAGAAPGGLPPAAARPPGLTARGRVDITDGGDRPGDFKIYAGCRADPFFTDPGKLLYNYLKMPQIYTLVAEEWAIEQASGGGFLGRLLNWRRVGAIDRLLDKAPAVPQFEVIARPRDEDNDWWSWVHLLKAEAGDRAQWLPLPTPFIRHSNVLAIVVELELEKAYGGPLPGPLFALAAETRKAGRTLDRDARPATNNLLFAKSVPYVLADQWIPELAALQDVWNRQDSFALDPAYEPQFRDALQTGAGLYDDSDGSKDWAVPNPSLDLILTDVLLFDATKPPATPSSDAPTYFEIEMAHFKGQPHTTFGGRLPNADSIDTFLTWFVNGPERYDRPRRTDGEDHPAKPANDEWPYLRPPHATLPDL